MRCCGGKWLAAAGLAAVSFVAEADTFTLVQSQPIEELWLNPGLYSYHFQREKGLNNQNYGFGAEYRFSTVSAVTAGVYHNSNSQQSRYLGFYWQPVRVGAVRLGAVAGLIDGYPGALNGGWFPALIPTASFEYEHLGVNVLFVPSYGNRIYGAVSFQLNLRIY